MKEKKINRIILTTLLITILSSCNWQPVISSNKIFNIIENGTDSTIRREYFPNPNKSLYLITTSYCNALINTYIYYHDIDKKKVREIETFLLKDKYGHHFEFYQNGILEEYCYYVGHKSESSYIRKYSESGKLIEEKGNPFVDYIKDEKNNIELHFSTVFFDSLSVEVRTKENNNKLFLKPSKMQPMLLNGTVKGNAPIYFLRITAYSSMSNNIKVYNDTIHQPS